MRKIIPIISMCVFAAYAQSGNAAGTYYNYGNYAAGNNYATSQSSGNRARASSQYLPSNQRSQGNYGAAQNNRQTNRSAAQQSSDKALRFDVFAGYDSADFGFDMNTARSEINFNNITWLKFGADMEYNLNMGGISLALMGGVEIGTQGESGNVTDDDMTKGGIFKGIVGFLKNPAAEEFLTYTDGSLVQVATTELVYGAGDQGKGSALGVYAAVGLGNGLKFGENVTLRPSVGFRYDSVSLKSQDVAAMTTLAVIGSDSELGYDENTLAQIAMPIADGGCQGCTMTFLYDAGNGQIGYEGFGGYVQGFDAAGNPFFLTVADYAVLPGVAHEYNVAWMGPFIAADLEAKVGSASSFGLRVELGFPGYSSEADQPYRSDLQHPTSFKDEAGMFSAMHYGLQLNYTGAINDMLALNIGWKWDYYSVENADTITYLSSESPYYPIYGDHIKTAKEVNARYKSSGVRAGITARF